MNFEISSTSTMVSFIFTLFSRRVSIPTGYSRAEKRLLFFSFFFFLSLPLIEIHIQGYCCLCAGNVLQTANLHERHTTHRYNFSRSGEKQIEHSKCLHLLPLFSRVDSKHALSFIFKLKGIESKESMKVNDFLITLVNLWTKKERSSILYGQFFFFLSLSPSLSLYSYFYTPFISRNLT